MKEVTVSLYTLIVRMYNFFTCNLQNRKFMVLIEDDTHFIHVKHHPKSSVTSTIWHMCTSVVDVQVNMRVVELEEDVTKYLLKVETITAKASYNTSLYNSKNSTNQIFILKKVLKN